MSVTASADAREAEGVCDACVSDAERAALAALAGKEGKEAKEGKESKKEKKKKAGGVDVGVCAEQGRRPTMEDADVALTDWHAASPSAPANAMFFGVYDGHGGQRAAEFVAKTLHHKICSTDAFQVRLCVSCPVCLASCCLGPLRVAFLDYCVDFFVVEFLLNFFVEFFVDFFVDFFVSTLFVNCSRAISKKLLKKAMRQLMTNCFEFAMPKTGKTAPLLLSA